MPKLSSALIIEYGFIKLVLYESRNGQEVYFGEKIIDYSGFSEYGFKNPEDVFGKIQNLFATCEKQFGKIDRITKVVIPGIFFKYDVEYKEVATDDGTVKKKDVEALLDSCEGSVFGYEPVEKTAVFYETAISAETLEPLGEKSFMLKGKISVGCLNLAVKELFDNCAKRMGRVFEYTSFIASTGFYAEKSLGGNEDRIIIFIADGHIDIGVVKGRAPLKTCSFCYGEGEVATAIAQSVKCSEIVAKRLLSHANLYIDFENDETQNYYLGGKSYAVKDVNFAILQTMEPLGVAIKGAVSDMTKEDYPVFVTGSKLCNLRGIKEVLMEEMHTKSNVELLTSDVINAEGCENFIVAALAENL